MSTVSESSYSPSSAAAPGSSTRSKWPQFGSKISPLTTTRMSHHQHDYYHSSKDSRRNDGTTIKREERLPSIHHMVGDPFERKASPYDFKDVKRSLPHVSNDPYSHHSTHDYGQRGPTLPPIYSGHSGSHSPYPSHTHSPTSRSHRDDASYHKSSYGDTLTVPGASRTRADYPSSQHGIFQVQYPTRSGDLVTVSTSSSPHGILRTSELPDEGDYDPKKKHKCPECGKRFDRPSGLDQHRLRHTGERPYSCPISNCDSTFTVRSNMTRHVRTQHHCEPDDADHYDGPSRHSGYPSTSRGSSDRSSPPSGSYYTSSRRR